MEYTHTALGLNLKLQQLRVNNLLTKVRFTRHCFKLLLVAQVDRYA